MKFCPAWKRRRGLEGNDDPIRTIMFFILHSGRKRQRHDAALIPFNDGNPALRKLHQACAEIPSSQDGGKDRGAAENLHIKAETHEYTFHTHTQTCTRIQTQTQNHSTKTGPCLTLLGLHLVCLQSCSFPLPSAPSLCFQCRSHLIYQDSASLMILDVFPYYSLKLPTFGQIQPHWAFVNHKILDFWFIDLFCRYGYIADRVSVVHYLFSEPTSLCSFASPSCSLNFIRLDVSFLFPVSWYAFRSVILAVLGLFSSFDFLAVIWFGGFSLCFHLGF